MTEEPNKTPPVTTPEPPLCEPRNNSAFDLSLNLLEVAAFPIAGLAGYLVAQNKSRFENHEVLVNNDTVLKRLREEHEEIVSALAKEGDRANFAKKLGDETGRYTQAARGRMKDMGFRGMTDHWKGLLPTKRLDIAIMGCTVSGLVLGAALMIAKHESIEKLLFSKNNNQNQGRSA